MAKIGNEARLILKLAEERIKTSKRLAKELEFLEREGNEEVREKLSWREAMVRGYNIGLNDYSNILREIAFEVENR